MSKLLTIIIAMVSFTLGYVTSTFSSHTSESTPQSNQQTDPSNTESGLMSQLNHNLNQVNASNVKILSQNNQEKIIEILNNLPESKIDHYLEQAFPEQNFEDIGNKRKFAERLLEEMNQDKDESNTLSGKVLISTNPTVPNASTQLNEVHQQQFIYAHFDTYGKVPPNTQVFVKWVNQDTQEIVLFAPKYIVEDAQQNWVSATPAKGWTPGRYDVKFYQMTDSLTPIAQSSYTIGSVLK